MCSTVRLTASVNLAGPMAGLGHMCHMFVLKYYLRPIFLIHFSLFNSCMFHCDVLSTCVDVFLADR